MKKNVLGRERKRKQDREFAGRFVFLAMIFDPNNNKIVVFWRQNAVKFDFSDEMTVGDHSKRFKIEEECSGERERKQEREFAGRFVFIALLFDPINSRIVDFLRQNAVKFDF